MDAESPVYLGVWTNWSRGSAVMGATLTTTRQYGNLLIAFTAFFIPFVASRFWRIFSLVFHQCYSTSAPRDAIHHQRQVVLRNSFSPESGLVSFIGLMWAWRHGDRPAWLRVFPQVLFLLCSICAFTVAGGFSSQISTAGEVLLRGDNCKIIQKGAVKDADLWVKESAYWSLYNNNLKNYAQSCYSNQSSGLLECSTFVTSSITTAEVDYNAPRPFEPGICVRNSSTLRLDTGHLNSNDIFGLNAPKDETLTFRNVLQCAPLVTEGRKNSVTISDQNFTTYSYGGQLQLNYTYAIPNVASQYPETKGISNTLNFLISPRGDLQLIGPTTIDVEDGDVIMMFLSGNGVHFMSRTEDDWYRATVPGGIYRTPEVPDNQTWYRPEEAASPLGCVEQFQWCRDPARGQCGKLAGHIEAVVSAAPWFGLTDELESERPMAKTKLGSLFIWAFMMQIGSGASLSWIVDTLGPASLASQKSVQGGAATGIEKNQWQLDVIQWWHILLAGRQSSFVNTAEGNANSVYRTYTEEPKSRWDWEFCRNQKIRSTQYSSFSIFGLAFLYGTGALIVLVSFVVEPVLGCLQRRGRYSRYAYLEWEGDTAIQLHRVAQDQLGYGRWSRCDEAIPVTGPGDLLAPFDLADPKHPLLARTVDDRTADADPEKPSRDSSSPEDVSAEHGNGGPSLDKYTLVSRESNLGLRRSNTVS